MTEFQLRCQKARMMIVFTWNFSVWVFIDTKISYIITQTVSNTQPTQSSSKKIEVHQQWRPKQC